MVKAYTSLTMPTMKNINASKKLFTGITFFAGCGGSSTGHKLAGVNMLYANEFVKDAQETYKTNHPSTIVDGRDIREVEAKDVLKAIGLKKGELDIMDGSPPCDSFSTAGKRDKGWGYERVHGHGGKTQRSDDLFFEYIRILKGIMPKTFVAENVSGMIKGSSRGYFIEVFKELEAAGYVVRAQLLNAAYMGVPQARERIIIVGVRKDIKHKLEFPIPTSWPLTVKEVLPHIDYIRAKRKDFLQYLPSDRPSQTITAADAATNENNMFSCSGFIETNEGIRRKYTIPELKKLFSFPSDFELTGSFIARWTRLGMSVAPLMMYGMSSAIMESVLKPYYEARRK